MVHRFLDFELDENLFELRSRGEVIATQSRVFALIAYLLHARDRVVGKGELMKALWKGNVVSETAISQVVMLARKALGDEGETQRVIKTVRGRGFRFVAPVTSAAAGAPSADSVDVASPQPREPEQALAGVRPSAPPAARAAPLLGRTRELDELSERLCALERGVGGVALIAGEPGIGKTSLAEAFAARAHERGVEVIWGRAWEDGGAPPFWPWVQVLRAMLQREDADQLRSYLHASAAGLLPLLPEQTRTEEAGRALPVLRPYGDDTEAARARFRQFDAMSRWLRFACGRAPGAESSPGQHRPRLIILDDLHAADAASIELARFLTPELREMGLLLVGTYRDLGRAGNPALAALAESCAAHTLRLSGLSPAESAELVAHRLGPSSPPRWARALHQLSLGNPLLLVALCSHFDADDPGPLVEFSELSDFAIPERVAGAVRRHMEQLPQGARELLSTASALGREFSLPLLAALAACSEAELLETLSPALRLGVLRQAPAGAARVVFSHGLVRNAVYAELSPSARIELHRRIGEVLERGAGSAGPPRLYEIAHHFFMAAADGGRLKALQYARQAADQAYLMMAYESAAGLYDRALQLAEHEPIERAVLHELLCCAGNAWSHSGELERARARFERAAALARAASDPERLAWAVVMSTRAHRGTVLHDTLRHQQIREALALLPPGDSEVKALVLSCSTLGLRAAGSAVERERATRAAVEMARRLGNDSTLLWTLNARHLVLWGAAAPDELVAIADEIIEIGRRTQDHELLLDGLMWRVLDHVELGDVLGALRAQHEYRVEAGRIGSPWHRYIATSCEILEAGAYCDFARVHELSERARALGVRLQDSLAEPFYAVRTLFLDLSLGCDTANHVAELLREPPSSVPADYRAFWALRWVEHGQLDEARAVLEQVMAQERAQLLLDQLRRPTLAAMAQVCARLGERAIAGELYGVLAPHARRQLFLQAGVVMGPVEYYLGMLAATLERRAQAREHFERAQALCEYARPLLLQVRYEYARVLAAEEPARARGMLREVEQAASSLGMQRLRARAQAALAQG
jgi:DNA-binding winged helix-turn-helix (wHTH) protein/tetratricopeptide (TPR) repeat protein